MSGDIVGRLQAFLPPGSIVPGWLVQDAINEIERLRAAGDALAEQAAVAAGMFRNITAYEDMVYPFLGDADAALAAWEEARRER